MEPNEGREDSEEGAGLPIEELWSHGKLGDSMTKFWLTFKELT